GDPLVIPPNNLPPTRPMADIMMDHHELAKTRKTTRPGRPPRGGNMARSSGSAGVRTVALDARRAARAGRSDASGGARVGGRGRLDRPAPGHRTKARRDCRLAAGMPDRLAALGPGRPAGASRVRSPIRDRVDGRPRPRIRGVSPPVPPARWERGRRGYPEGSQ